MNTPSPRYEFRAFDRDFGITESLMRARAPAPRIRESGEVYLLSRGAGRHNVKIRGDALDIKALLGEEDGLEQWTPILKEPFPVATGLLQERVFSVLGVEAAALERSEYTAPQLVEEVVRSHEQLVAATVLKTRFGFLIEDCSCEIADIVVNGARIRTACVESIDPEQVLDLVRELRLDSWSNASYLTGLKRITGLSPVPLPF